MYHDPGFSALNSRLNMSILANPRRPSKESASKLQAPTPVQAQFLKIPTQRVFLDLTLEDIANLPEQYSNLEIGFKHSNGIKKVKRSCVAEPNNLELNKFEYYKPVYRLNIEPQNIENLNKISDEPIMITLYEHIKPKPKFHYWPFDHNEEDYFGYIEDGEEEEEEYDDVEEQLIPLAQGHLDFLQLLTEQKVTISMEAFMYSTNYRLNELSSLKTNWKFKSAVPLLGEKIADIIFIAMESIYNAPLELIEQSENLGVKLSFQTKRDQLAAPTLERRSTTSRRSRTNKSSVISNNIEICRYEHFQSTVIVNQAVCLKWESLKDVDVDNFFCVGIHTPIRIKTLHPYVGLLRTEYVDFQLDKINNEEDIIIVANSLHRYLLPQEYCQILEEIIACNEQHILVEVYHIDSPHIILYDGILNLSVLTFPEVNARRFAVELRPKFSRSSIARSLKRSTTTERLSKKSMISENRNSSLKPENSINGEQSAVPEVEKPVFIIISICLQTPISETSISDSKQLTSVPITENRCTYFPVITKNNTLNICEGLYHQFEKLNVELVEYIINRKIKAMSEAQDYFCCQLSEMRNLLSGIIACDYNTKYQTTSNVEFTRLITKVYNDMENRLMDIVLKVIKNNENLPVSVGGSEAEIILLSGIVRYARELKLNIIENVFNKKLMELYGKNFKETLDFFQYFFNVENENFEEGKLFEHEFNKSKLSPYAQFRGIMETYTCYRLSIKHYDPNELLSSLLDNILCYAKTIPDRIEGWILLYCYYARHLYYPGMEFARQKYEDLFDKLPIKNPAFPISRWTMYNSFTAIEVQSKKMHAFLLAMLHYAYLGLYIFADIILIQVATELTDPIKYLLKTTIMILMNELPETFEIDNFVLPNNKNDDSLIELQAALTHVNGHAAFHLGKLSDAMDYYAQIRDMQVENFEDYKLGLMRYAYFCLDNQNYDEATKTFLLFCDTQINNMDAHYGMSRALYFLNKLDECEKHLAIITRFRMHIPDVWAYLALVNLRMGKIFKALEFWKYANLLPPAHISEEILQELGKIDHKSLDLYVDKPKEPYEWP